LVEKLLYPSGEEVFDWAEAKAKFDEECRAEAEALREDRYGNGGVDRSPLDYDNLSEKQPDFKGETYRNDDRIDHHDLGEDSSEGSEIEGELPPLVQEGRRIMVCINYELRQTRYGFKDYLKWIDEDTGLLLHQFFHHYDKYPVGSKAVKNYIAAMDKRPKRLDRISLRKLVGLRAEVFVETVRPTFIEGGLQGEAMPETLNYSKVAQILRPLGRVDTDTLNQLRKRC